jgi:hypothetical protein
MLGRVVLVTTHVSEELSASFIKVTRIGELGTTLAVTCNSVFLRSVRLLLVTANVPSSSIILTLMELNSYETSVLIRATRRNIPEDGILQTAVELQFSRCMAGWKPLLVFDGDIPMCQAVTCPAARGRENPVDQAR